MATVSETDVDMSELNTVLGPVADPSGQISLSSFYGANNFVPGPPIPNGGPISFSMFQNETRITQNVVATVSGLTSLGMQVNWTTAPTATAYYVTIYSANDSAMTTGRFAQGDQNPTSTQAVITPTFFSFSPVRGKYYGATVRVSYGTGIYANSAISTGLLFPYPPISSVPFIDSVSANSLTLEYTSNVGSTYKAEVFESDISGSFTKPVTTQVSIGTSPATITDTFVAYPGKYYAVKTYATNINGTTASGFSPAAMLPPPPTTGVVMSEFTTSERYPGYFDTDVTWNPNPYASSYIVTIDASDGQTVASYTNTADFNGAIIEFLPSPSTYYHAKVRALNLTAYSDSSYSDFVYAPGPPPAPVNVRLTNFTPFHTLVSWQAGIPENILDVCGSDLFYMPELWSATDSSMTANLGIFPMTPIIPESIATPQTNYRLSYSAVSGNAGLYYAVKVNAINIIGSNSTFSPSVFMPLPPVPPTPVLTNMTKTSYDISWNSKPGETYQYQLWQTDASGNFGKPTTGQNAVVVTKIVDSTDISQVSVNGHTTLGYGAYYYSVKMNASNLLGRSDFSGFSPPSQVKPPVPLGVICLPFTDNNTFTVEWQNNPYADFYTIEVFQANDASLNGLSDNPVVVQSTLSNYDSEEITFNPTAGKYYTAWVNATNLGGSSAFTAYATPGRRFPAPPNPPASASLTGLTRRWAYVSWTASPAGDDPVVNYNYTIYSATNSQMTENLTAIIGGNQDPPATTEWVTPPVSPIRTYFTVTSGLNGLYYAVGVTAANLAGNSSTRFSTSILVPVPPQQPVAQILQLTPSNVQISWTPLQTETYRLEVFRATATNGFSTGDCNSILYTDISSTSPYTANGSFGGDGYYYAAQVIASNSAGEPARSIFTNIVQPAPAAPTGVRMDPFAFSSSGGVVSTEVAWTPPLYATSYTVNIYSDTNPSLTSPTLVSSATTEVTGQYSASAVIEFEGTSGRYYGAKVTARSLGGSNISVFSSNVGVGNTVYIRGPPAAPSNVNITNFFDLGQYLDVSWAAGAVTDGNTATYYSVQITSLDTESNPQPVEQDPTLELQNAEPYLITTPKTTAVSFIPVSGWSYRARVVAYNEGGSNAALSSPSVYPYAPSRPVVSISSMTSNTLSITWTPVSGETYKAQLFKATTPNLFALNPPKNPFKVVNVTTSPAAISGSYADGQFYAVKLVATNPVGTALSLFSDAAQPTPNAPTEITLTTPTGTLPYLATIVEWINNSEGLVSNAASIYDVSGNTLIVTSNVAGDRNAASISFSASPSHSYYAKVTALSYSSSAASSNSGNVTIPSPPSVSSVSISNVFTYGDYVDVSWVSTGNSYVTIDISGSFDQSPSSTTAISTFPFGASNYPIFFTPTRGQIYNAIVRAYNSVGDTASNVSDPFNYPVKPTAPTALLTRLTTTEADISWTTPDVNNGETFNITLWQGNSYNSFALKEGLLPVASARELTTAVTLTGTFTDDFYYSAKVTASNRADVTSSTYSSILQPSPSPPTNVTFGPFIRNDPIIDSIIEWSSPLSTGYFLVGIYPSNSVIADVSYTVTAGTNAVIVTNDWLSGSNYRAGVRSSNTTGISTEAFSGYRTFPVSPDAFTVNLLRYTSANEQLYWTTSINSIYYTVSIYDLSTSAIVVTTSNISNFANYTSPSRPYVIAFNPIYGHGYQTIVTSYGLGGSTSNTDISFTYPTGTAVPTDLSFVTMTTDRIDISWTPLLSTSYYASVFTAPDATSLALDIETDEIVTDAFVSPQSPYVYGYFPYDGFIYAVKLRASNVNGFGQRTAFSRVLMPPPTQISSVTLSPFNGTIGNVESLLIWPPIEFATTYTTNLFQEDTSGLVYSNVSTNPNIYADVLTFSNTGGFYPTNGKYYYANVTATALDQATESSNSASIYFPNPPTGPSSVTVTDFFTMGRSITVNWLDPQEDIDAASYYTIRIDQSGVPITTQNPASTDKLDGSSSIVYFTGEVGSSYTATVTAWNLGGSNSFTSTPRIVPYPPPLVHPVIDSMTLSNITVSWDSSADVSYSLTVYGSQDYYAFAQAKNPNELIQDYLLTSNPQTIAGTFTYDNFYYAVTISAFYGIIQPTVSSYSLPSQPAPIKIQDVSMIGLSGSASLVTSEVKWTYQNYPTSYQIKLYSSPTYSPFTPTLVSNYTVDRNLSSYQISYVPQNGRYYAARVIGSNLGGASPESELSTDSIYFPNLPDAPSNVRIPNFFPYGERFVDISWDHTQTGVDAPTYYTATFFDVCGETTVVSYQRPAATDPISNDLGYDIKPLGGHYYFVSVYAWNLAGSKDASSSPPNFYPFLPAVPQPSITIMTTNSMDISWTSYKGETYAAAVWAATDPTYFGKNDPSVSSILGYRDVTSSYTITEPNAFTLDDLFYSVTITASNLGGLVPSDKSRNYSPANQPLPFVPTDVSMYEFVGTTSELTWKTSRYASTYSINIYAGATLISNFLTTNSTDTYTVDISTIPGTYYSAEIAASNLGGLTAYSTRTSEVYYKKNPYPASNVVLSNFFTDGQYATVSWDISSGIDQADYYDVQIIGTQASQEPFQTSIVTGATSPQNVFFTPLGGYSYYAAVYAYNNTGRTDASSSSEIFYPNLVPIDKVTIADITPDSITIDWIQQPNQKYALWVYNSENTADFTNGLRLEAIKNQTVLGGSRAFSSLDAIDISGTQIVGGSNRWTINSPHNFESEGQYYAAFVRTYRTYGITGSFYSPWSALNEPRPTAITSVTFNELIAGKNYPIVDISWSHTLYATSNSISFYEVDNSTNFTGNPANVLPTAVQDPYVLGNAEAAEVPFYSTPEKCGKYFTARVTATNLNPNSTVSSYMLPAFYFPNPPTAPTDITLFHFFTLGQYISVYWTPPVDSFDDATYYKLSVDQSGTLVPATGADGITDLSSVVVTNYKTYTSTSPYDIYFTPEAGKSYTVTVYATNVASSAVAYSAPYFYSGIPAKPTPVITRLTPRDLTVSWTPYEGEDYTLFVYAENDVKKFTGGKELDPDLVLYDLSGTPGTLSYYEYTSTGEGTFSGDGNFYAVKILAEAFYGPNGSNLSLFSEVEQPPPVRPAFIGSGQLVTSGTSTYLDISWGYSRYGESNTINLYKVTNGAGFTGDQGHVGNLTDISFTTTDNAVASDGTLIKSIPETRGRYFTANVTTGNYGGTVRSDYSVPPIYFPNFPNSPLNVTLTDFTKGYRTVSWEPAATGDPPTLGYLVEMYSSDLSGVRQISNLGGNPLASNILVDYTQDTSYSIEFDFVAASEVSYFAKVIASNYAGSNQVDASSAEFYFPPLPGNTAPTITSITPTALTAEWVTSNNTSYSITVWRADIVSNYTYGVVDRDGNTIGVREPAIDYYPVSTSPATIPGSFLDEYKIYAVTLVSSNIAGTTNSGFSIPSETLPAKPEPPTINSFTSSYVDVSWTFTFNAEAYLITLKDTSGNTAAQYYTSSDGTCNTAITDINRRAYRTRVNPSRATLASWTPTPGRTYYATLTSLNLGNLYSNSAYWTPYTSDPSTTFYYPRIPPAPNVTTFTFSSLTGASVTWAAGIPINPLDAATYYTAEIGKYATIAAGNATFVSDTEHLTLNIFGTDIVDFSGYFTDGLILSGNDLTTPITIIQQQTGDFDNKSDGSYLVSGGNTFASNTSLITGTGEFTMSNGAFIIYPSTTSILTFTGTFPFDYTIVNGDTLSNSEFQQSITVNFDTCGNIIVPFSQQLNTTQPTYITNVSFNLAAGNATFVRQNQSMTITDVSSGSFGPNMLVYYPPYGVFKLPSSITPGRTSGIITTNIEYSQNPTTNVISGFSNAYFSNVLPGLAPYSPDIQLDDTYLSGSISEGMVLTSLDASAIEANGGPFYLYVSKVFQTGPTILALNARLLDGYDPEYGTSWYSEWRYSQLSAYSNFVAFYPKKVITTAGTLLNKAANTNSGTITLESSYPANYLPVGITLRNNLVPGSNFSIPILGVDGTGYIYTTDFASMDTFYGGTVYPAELVNVTIDLKNSVYVNLSDLGSDGVVVESGHASFSNVYRSVSIISPPGTIINGSTLSGFDVSGIQPITIGSQISGTTGGAGVYSVDKDVALTTTDILTVSNAQYTIPSGQVHLSTQNSFIDIIPATSSEVAYGPEYVSFYYNSIPIQINYNPDLPPRLNGIILPGQTWSGSGHQYTLSNLGPGQSFSQAYFPYRTDNPHVGEVIPTDISFTIVSQVSTYDGVTSNKLGRYLLDKSFLNLYGWNYSGDTQTEDQRYSVLRANTTLYINPGRASCTTTPTTMTISDVASGALSGGMELNGTDVSGISILYQLSIDPNNNEVSGGKGRYYVTGIENLTNASNIVCFGPITQSPGAGTQYTSPGTYSFTNVGFEQNNSYSTRVKAYNRSGNSSSFSPIKSFPKPPIAQAATDIGMSMDSSSVTVQWRITNYDLSNSVSYFVTIDGLDIAGTFVSNILCNSSAGTTQRFVATYDFSRVSLQSFAAKITSSNIIGSATSEYSAITSPNPTPPTNVRINSFGAVSQVVLGTGGVYSTTNAFNVSWSPGAFASQYYIEFFDASGVTNGGQIGSSNKLLACYFTGSNVTNFNVVPPRDLFTTQTWRNSDTSSNISTFSTSNDNVSVTNSWTSKNVGARVYSWNYKYIALSNFPAAPTDGVQRYITNSVDASENIYFSKTSPSAIPNVSSDSPSILLPSRITTGTAFITNITSDYIDVSWTGLTYTDSNTLNIPIYYQLFLYGRTTLGVANISCNTFVSQTDTPRIYAPFKPFLYRQNNVDVYGTFPINSTWQYLVGVKAWSTTSNPIGIAGYVANATIGGGLRVYATGFSYTFINQFFSSNVYSQTNPNLIPGPGVPAVPSVVGLTWYDASSSLTFNVDPYYTAPYPSVARSYTYSIITSNAGSITTTNPAGIVAGSNSISLPSYASNSYAQWFIKVTSSNEFGSNSTSNILLPPTKPANIQIDKWTNDLSGNRTFYISWTSGVNFTASNTSIVLYYASNSAMTSKSTFTYVNSAVEVSPNNYVSPLAISSGSNTTTVKVTTNTYSSASNILNGGYTAGSPKYKVGNYFAAMVTVSNTSGSNSATQAVGNYVIPSPSTPIPTITEMSSNTFLVAFNLSNISNTNFHPSNEPSNSYRVAILQDTSTTNISSSVKWSNVPSLISYLWLFDDMGNVSTAGGDITVTLTANSSQQGYTENRAPRYYYAIVEAYNQSGNTSNTSPITSNYFYWP